MTAPSRAADARVPFPIVQIAEKTSACQRPLLFAGVLYMGLYTAAALTPLGIAISQGAWGDLLVAAPLMAGSLTFGWLPVVLLRRSVQAGRRLAAARDQRALAALLEHRLRFWRTLSYLMLAGLALTLVLVLALSFGALL